MGCLRHPAGYATSRLTRMKSVSSVSTSLPGFRKRRITREQEDLRAETVCQKDCLVQQRPIRIGAVRDDQNRGQLVHVNPLAQAYPMASC
jgi:hypothetical protein